MPRRDPRTTAVAILGVLTLVAAFLVASRVMAADDAAADRIRDEAAVTVSAVSAQGEVEVQIREGALPDEIVTRLAEVGVVADEETLRALMFLTGAGPELKSGDYEFSLDLPPAEVLRRLREGPPRIERITFRPGLRVEEIGETLQEEGYFTAAEWAAAVANARPREFMGDETDFLGYLMPGQYEIRDETTAASLLEEMLDRFEEEVTPSLVSDAEAQDWSLYEILTLASVVEREAAIPEEKPLVAAVFRNRIEQGMALQADPTVQFALTVQPDGEQSVQEFGWWKRELTIDDLGLDSPYNTYFYPGLMPGPIANPNIESIRSTVSPAPVDYVYFVAAPECDGSHLFASTLEEHNVNVEIFRASECAASTP